MTYFPQYSNIYLFLWTLSALNTRKCCHLVMEVQTSSDNIIAKVFKVVIYSGVFIMKDWSMANVKPHV